MSTVAQLIEDVVEEMKVYCLTDSVNIEYVMGPWRIYKMRHELKEFSSMER